MKNQSSKKWVWKTVDGTTALLLDGNGAEFNPKAIKEKSNDEENIACGHQNTHLLPGDDMVVAEVSDDMSFIEALTSARNKVGAGWVFFWQGGIYSTCSQEEWDSISEDEIKNHTERTSMMFLEPENNEQTTGTQKKEEMAAVVINTIDTTDDETIGNDDIVAVVCGEYDGPMVDLDAKGDGYADTVVIDVDEDGFLSTDDLPEAEVDCSDKPTRLKNAKLIHPNN